jgi:hypothetical protein
MRKRILLTSLTTLALATIALLGQPLSAQETQVRAIAGTSLIDLQKIGYRVDWINQSPTTGLYLPTVTENSFYTMNQRDYLSRYDASTGKWLWSIPVGNNIFDMLSINEFDETDRVTVFSDGVIYNFNTLTGTSPTGADSKPLTNLRWISNTPAIQIDNALVYGSTKGDLVWLNPGTGSVTARYQIGDSVKTTPAALSAIRHPNGRMRDIIIGTAVNGTISAIDKSSKSKLWSFQLTAPVTATVSSATNSTLINDETFPRSTIFIAGTDQYLRAVDFHTGRPRWRVLTSAKLTTPPAIYENVLYQHIPQEGLACFETFPQDFSGKKHWTANEVYGDVITTTATGRLVCWDNVNKVLQILDPHNGGVTNTLSLPRAKEVLSDNPLNGSLFILTEDDEIIRLAQ